MMNIILCDTNAEIVNQWRHYCEDVEIVHKDFRSLSASAIISPANSFAIMDGGVDLFIRNYFGEKIQNKIRYKATYEFGMPIVPVGSSIGIELNHENYEYLISSPTMNYPINISKTINGYLATRSALHTADIIGCNSVLMFGMGGFSGGYSPKQCANQMGKALKDFREGRFYTEWEEVKNDLITLLHQ